MNTPTRRIVFVCTGNICRSAMAEYLLRHWAQARGFNLETASCGIAAESWYEVPEVSKRLLAAEGVSHFKHKPRLATRETLREADLILAMTQEHLDYIVERFPEFARRTRLFREQAGFGKQDVEDPMCRPEKAFEACLAVLKETLEALLLSNFRDPA